MVTDGADWGPATMSAWEALMWRRGPDPRTRSAGDPAGAARREPEWSRLVAVHERMTAKIPRPRDRGLRRHDTFALLSENSLRYYEAYRAPQ
jgi:hypothetical protein